MINLRKRVLTDLVEFVLENGLGLLSHLLKKVNLTLVEIVMNFLEKRSISGIPVIRILKTLVKNLHFVLSLNRNQLLDILDYWNFSLCHFAFIMMIVLSQGEWLAMEGENTMLMQVLMWWFEIDRITL